MNFYPVGSDEPERVSRFIELSRHITMTNKLTRLDSWRLALAKFLCGNALKAHITAENAYWMATAKEVSEHCTLKVEAANLLADTRYKQAAADARATINHKEAMRRFENYKRAHDAKVLANLHRLFGFK